MNSLTEKNALLTYTKETNIHVQSTTAINNYLPTEATTNTRHLERVWSPNKFNQKKSELLTLAIDSTSLNTSWSYFKQQSSTPMEPKTPSSKHSLPITQPSPPSPTSSTSSSSSYSDTEQSMLRSTAAVAARNNKSGKTATDGTTTGDPLSPMHHARRPMNAFLIFCKKHRPVVRRKFLSLENRAVTKILGEWWALLEAGEKEAYTTLAREYKDAFFNANPNFKWYKLPAPPLRTLHTRPSTNQILRQLSTSSATTTTTSALLTTMAGILSGHNTITGSTCTSVTSTTDRDKGVGGGGGAGGGVTTGGCNKELSGRVEFTPGKLADESQLGKLSSLLNMSSNNNIQMENSNYYSYNNNNYNIHNNNNSTTYTSINDSSSNINTPEGKHINCQTPLQPIKKHTTHDQNQIDSFTNMFNISPNRIIDPTVSLNENPCQTIENSVINVDRNNLDSSRVARNLFDDEEADGSEERKVGRKCKGQRYKEFMINGKLLKNKRDKFSEDDADDVQQMDSNSQDNSLTPRSQLIDLDTTIKMLAERTHIKLPESPHNKHQFDNNAPSEYMDSFIRNNDNTNNNGNSAFNLDDKIAMLPSLSYEQYVRRKRDSKNRSKFVRNRSHDLLGKSKVKRMEKSTDAATTPTASGAGLVGSKKRKNKQNITHLKGKNIKEFMVKENKVGDKGKEVNVAPDLFGLATLAEIAANTEKLNQ